MSLQTDGVWKSGVWAPTVWADGVWFEGVQTPGTGSVRSTGGGGGGLGWFLTKRGKRRYHEFFEDIVDEVKREMEMERMRAELVERFARQGMLAEQELEEAIAYMAEQQRKRRRRRAAVILMLDS